MDNNQSDRVFAFDSLFTTNHIQMLKLLAGCMAPSVQGRLAVYIKFMELQHTMKMVANHPTISIFPCQSDENHGVLPSLIDEMCTFCRPEEKEQLKSFKNMFQTIENMQKMIEMIELFKEMAPEMFSGDENAGPDFSQILNMSGEMDMSQMMDMMHMMQGIFSPPNE